MKKLFLAAALAASTTAAAATDIGNGWSIGPTEDGGVYAAKVSDRFRNTVFAFYAYPEKDCSPILSQGRFFETKTEDYHDWEPVGQFDVRVDGGTIWEFKKGTYSFNRLDSSVDDENGNTYYHQQRALLGTLGHELENEIRFGTKLIIRQGEGEKTDRLNLSGSNNALNRLSNDCFDLQRQEADNANEWGTAPTGEWES